MSLVPTTDDWRKLSEACLWLHESASWQDLAKRSPHILHHVIGADLCCWNEVDAAINLPSIEMTEGYENTFSDIVDTLLEKLPAHPLLPNNEAVTDWPEVCQISDVVSQGKFENSGLYQDAYRHLDTRFQLMGQPFLGDDFTILFSINRKHHNFDDRDRQLFSNLLGHFRIACDRLQENETIQARLKLFEDLANEHSGILKFSSAGDLLEVNDIAKRLIDFHFPNGKKDFLSKCKSLITSAD